MRGSVAAAIALATALAAPVAASAESTEDKLREALRRAVVDLHAAQDSIGTLQATLLETQKQRDTLQQQVTQLAAQAAQAPKPPPGPTPEELQAAKEAIAALQQQNAQLQQGLAHWQSAYRQAAQIAQAKDAESRQCAATLQTAKGTLGVCTRKNGQLTTVANGILHLYETPDFRSLVRGSWEPLLGYKRVELETIVQDTGDKILDQRYYPGEQPPAPPKPPAKP